MIAVAVSGPHPLAAQCTAHRAHARRGSMLRALKMHGGVARVDLGRENVDAARAGCANLPRHLVNVEQFGVPVVVAVNQFSADTEAELQAVVDAAGAEGAQAIVCSHWADGGAGTEALVRHVVEIVEAHGREREKRNDQGEHGAGAPRGGDRRGGGGYVPAPVPRRLELAIHVNLS